MNTKTLLAGLTIGVTILTTVTAAAAEFVQARWIAPAAGVATNFGTPMFRKEFILSRTPGRSSLRIVGLGDFDVRVNGRRVTETGMNQPWSQYEKTIYYRDFNISGMLREGPNCVGVTLGNSFWNNPDPPKGRYNKAGPQRKAEEPFLLRAEVRWEVGQGGAGSIGTDESWRTANAPVVFSHVYAGEDFDARLQQPAWDKVGFDDHLWKPAHFVTTPPGELAPLTAPGIQAFSPEAPVSVKEPAAGVFLYTFPHNTAAQLKVELTGGKAGDRIQFRCGEHKNANDRLFGGYIVGSDLITDGQALTNQWTFFYLGMQFIEVSGAVPEGQGNPGNLPVIHRLELVPVRAGLPEAGSFACSSDLYNRTHQLIDGAIRANMNWVMTDCPHREKLGWLECAYLLEPSFLYRYDGREWFSKIAHDIRDAQEPSGRVLTVAPSYPAGRFPGAFNWTVEWGAASVMVPWQHYVWFGDRQIIKDNYEMMRRFTDYIGTQAKDGVAPAGLGDWYDYGHGKPPGPSRFTPTELTATATWALCADAIARAAEVLRKADDVRTYSKLHARIAADFQRHFQDPITHKLHHNGSPQCANAMALCADVVPAEDRRLLLVDIIEDLQKRGWQQTPGDVGHVYLIRALAEAGQSDILHRIYSRTGLGSYGGILAKGLTSLPETWDAMMDGSQSLDHCMLGHVMEWYYGYVGGIRQAPDSVGWRKVLIAPNPGPLTNAETVVQTPRGRVASKWHRDGTNFVLETDVPRGIEATVIFPSGATRPVRSGKQTLQEPMPTAAPEVTVAAYYYPCEHPDPRWDKAKYPGFTEWDLIRKAKPRFPGHEQPKTPLWRYTDESDPSVMAQKIDAAANYGVNAFIFDWYYYDDGPYLEAALDRGFLCATNNSRVKFGLMWANHDWFDIQGYNPKDKVKLLYPGKVSKATWDKITDLVIARYFKHPSYWTIDGKPYFSIYEMSLFLENFGSVEAARVALDGFRAKAKAAGFPGLHINAVLWGQPNLPGGKTPADWPKLCTDLGLDSLTGYTWVHHGALDYTTFPVSDYTQGRDVYLKFYDSAVTKYPVPYFPNATINWDNSPRAAPEAAWDKPAAHVVNPVMIGNTPAAFREACEIIKARLLAAPTTPKIITINAWNEWPEGSVLEPEKKYGYGYLEAIKAVFGSGK